MQKTKMSKLPSYDRFFSYNLKAVAVNSKIPAFVLDIHILYSTSTPAEPQPVSIRSNHLILLTPRSLTADEATARLQKLALLYRKNVTTKWVEGA